METLKCINCENHADFKMECKISNGNYNKTDKEINACFILSRHLKSMDKCINLMDKIINKLT